MPARPANPALRLALAVALLVPSAWNAWRFRDCAHAGTLHDDALYLIGARSLASTGEYRLESLPDRPWQTKYPPLYPAWLSLAWRFEPRFPEVLPGALLLHWLWMPLLLFAAWRLTAEFTASEPLRWSLTAMLMLHSLSLFYSVFLMSELMANTLVLMALADARRRPARAGAFAAAAILTRTASVALLPAFAVWFLHRREWRNALVSVAPGGLAAAGWAAWGAAHRSPVADMNVLYYTDYLGYFTRAARETTAWAAHLQFGAESLGRVLVPAASPSGFAIAASLAGLATLVIALRHRGPQPWLLFAVFHLALAAWWAQVWPPDGRLLLVAFLPVWGAIAGSRPWQKTLLGLAAAGALYTGLSNAFEHLPRRLEIERQVAGATRPAYAWISSHTAPDDTILSAADGLVWLHTGRRGMNLIVPLWRNPRVYPPALAECCYDWPAFARARRLRWVMLATPPLTYYYEPADIRAILQRSAAAMPLAYQGPWVRIFRAE